MKKAIPEYKTVIYNGIQYYRTRIEDADGKRVAIYGKTREELRVAKKDDALKKSRKPNGKLKKLPFVETHPR